MKKIMIWTAYIFFTCSVQGQDKTVGDSLRVSFLKLDRHLVDSHSFLIKIAYENITNRDILIYKELSEGYLDDRFHNINIEMQKLVKGKYVNDILRFQENGNEYSLVDSIRHYDLVKIRYTPHSIDTLTLDLFDIGAGFEKGKYRFRSHVRIETIRDNREYIDETLSLPPPRDTIRYITSDWIYFTVPKDIYKPRKRSSLR